MYYMYTYILCSLNKKHISSAAVRVRCLFDSKVCMVFIAELRTSDLPLCAIGGQTPKVSNFNKNYKRNTWLLEIRAAVQLPSSSSAAPGVSMSDLHKIKNTSAKNASSMCYKGIRF